MIWIWILYGFRCGEPEESLLLDRLSGGSKTWQQQPASRSHSPAGMDVYGVVAAGLINKRPGAAAPARDELCGLEVSS